MKTIDLSEATASLRDYAQGGDPIVLTDGGHAIAALVPIDDDDAESLTLSLSPKFQAMIERSRHEHRAGASLSAEEVRRALGLS
jgi:antitoxin (DNA-binding transcriptional repressor) of toxin-antitoxin stability system